MARKLAQRVPYVCASPAYTARHGMPNSLSNSPATPAWWATATVALHPGWPPHSVRVHGLLHCNSGHALLDAALKGIGIIQLPDYYVSDHLAQGELIELLPGCGRRRRDLGLYPTTAISLPRYGCWWTIWRSG